jgi:crotonobetaine/carnitine-CoA ligase
LNAGNVAELLALAAERRPEAVVGMVGRSMPIWTAYRSALDVARGLLNDGLEPGDPVVLLGANSNEWLIAWMALQFAGARTALLNPSLPDDLLAAVVAPLRPVAAICTDVGRDAESLAPRMIDLSPRAGVGWSDPAETAGGADGVADGLPGFDSRDGEISSYMLTSGTTGPPKLVAQSHAYFLSLGRYVADQLGITRFDTVLTTLPLFHINPLGYAVLGALSAEANWVVTERFSASQFWPTVRDSGVSVTVLHGPPLEILKRRTTLDDARGHRLRSVLFADPEFLGRFEVPMGLSVYGSTEGGGLSASHRWRASDVVNGAEGATHRGGRARPGFTHEIGEEGEIVVTAERAELLGSGYVAMDGGLTPLVTDGGFHTGDRGYLDDSADLIFVARQSESIRVKGEFVPISYVEDHFRASLDGVRDLAIWKRPSDLVDEEIVLYLEGDDPISVGNVRRASSQLPPFMRPAHVVRLEALPRDTTVGKTRRRELAGLVAIEQAEL